MCRRSLFPGFVVGFMVSMSALPGEVCADAFDEYVLMDYIELPQPNSVFDVLPDGRLIVLYFAEVYEQTAVGSQSFNLVGTLPGANVPPSYGMMAFIRVSPDGTRIAVGNNGGSDWETFELGIFERGTLTGTWYGVNHYDAAWYDDTRLVVTAGDYPLPSWVTVFDTSSETNPIIIDNIGGDSGGIAFDASGNLYTGNGWTNAGPSGTGCVKAFDHASWTAALAQGIPLDFENSGTLVVDVLSAQSLGFDAEGNLHVGGGDVLGGVDEQDFVALVRASAVNEALAGQGPADPDDSEEVRRFDPDTMTEDNYYSVRFNPVTHELCMVEWGDTIVYAYWAPFPSIPTVSEWGLVLMFMLVLTAGTLILRRGRRGRNTTAGMLAFGVLASVALGDSPFAVEVVDFAPAPGQFVNIAEFNDPNRALGPPSGGGTYDSNNTSLVSLGGFGGSLTLRFNHVVEDHPLNAYGMDAIVFGNAFWVDDEAQRHWAECATIEIALDVDENGWIDEDEGWYLIPGSHLTDPALQYAWRTWDDDPSTDIPPESLSWVPPAYTGTWSTATYELPPDVFAAKVIENPSLDPEVEGIYGYAEYTPTLVLGDLDADNIVDDPLIAPEEYYTVPDDPLTIGISAGSGGGDAFDIGWAIDPETGQPAELAGFNFIRLTNPTDAILPYFKEKSPEIDAVADAAVDPFGDYDVDGDIDLRDAAGFQCCLGGLFSPQSPCALLDREGNGTVDLDDYIAFAERIAGLR